MYSDWVCGVQGGVAFVLFIPYLYPLSTPGSSELQVAGDVVDCLLYPACRRTTLRVLRAHGLRDMRAHGL